VYGNYTDIMREDGSYSATDWPDPSSCAELLFSREISSSHGGEYDVQSCLLGYTAV
jgi:hypothetical protein